MLLKYNIDAVMLICYAINPFQNSIGNCSTSLPHCLPMIAFPSFGVAQLIWLFYQ